jgi:hypothetical protein
MKTAWASRPHEERTLLNPAYLALVLFDAASAYQNVGGLPMPSPLAFLVPPLALHPATRAALPKAVSTSLPAWVQRNEGVRVAFPERARALAPITWEALAVAMQTGILDFEGGNLTAGSIRRRHPRRYEESETMEHTRSAAAFLGRWFARAGSVPTVYAQLGVKP